MSRCISRLALFLLLVPLQGQQLGFDFATPKVVADKGSRIDDLADFDQDGDLDGIGWWWNHVNTTVTARFRIFRNDDGNLSPSTEVDVPVTYVNGGIISYLPTRWDGVAGDLDGDGDPDYAVVIGQDLTVFFCAGTNTAPTPVNIPLGTTAQQNSIVAADFDLDGDLDLAVGSEGSGVRLIENQGGGLFVPAPTGLAQVVDSLVAADIDGDPGTELVGVRGTSLYFIQVQGLVPSIQGSVFTGLPTLIPPLSGDIDGDGDDDVVLFTEAGLCSVSRRVGPTTFLAEAPTAGGPADRLADVDGDGDLDGICCGGGGGGGSGPNLADNVAPSHFRISINDGSGNFAAAWTMDGIGSSRLAGMADIYGDGHLDLVGGRCVYYGREGLGATQQGTAPVTGHKNLPVVDYDRDGDLDVVDQIVGGIGVNDAAGGLSIQPGTVIGVPAGMAVDSTLAVGDFDGDGFMDAVARSVFVSPLSFHSMRLLRGDGNGRFLFGPQAGGLAQNFVTGGGMPPLPAETIVADVDDDGDLDIVTNSSTAADPSRLWINDSHGFFTFGPSLQKHIAHCVDLDGDGRKDLVDTLGFFAYGVPGGGFGTWSFGPFTSSLRVGVRDLDGDGDLDLLGLFGQGTAGSILMTYENLGARNFVLHQQPLPDFFPDGDPTWNAIDAFDLNGDGRLDAVVNRPVDCPGGIAIFPGLPGAAGQFGSPEVWMAPLRRVADVDGDGDLDLIGSGILVFNRLRTPETSGCSRQYGQGTAGSGGIVPRIGARGPFEVNGTANFDVTGLLGGTSIFVVVGDQAVNQPNYPLPGLTNYTNAAFYNVFTVGGAWLSPGAGEFHFGYFMPPFLAGLSLYHQVYAYDPLTPGFFSSSGGLLISYR